MSIEELATSINQLTETLQELLSYGRECVKGRLSSCSVTIYYKPSPSQSVIVHINKVFEDTIMFFLCQPTYKWSLYLFAQLILPKIVTCNYHRG